MLHRRIDRGRCPHHGWYRENIYKPQRGRIHSITPISLSVCGLLTALLWEKSRHITKRRKTLICFSRQQPVSAWYPLIHRTNGNNKSCQTDLGIRFLSCGKMHCSYRNAGARSWWHVLCICVGTRVMFVYPSGYTEPLAMVALTKKPPRWFGLFGAAVFLSFAGVLAYSSSLCLEEKVGDGECDSSNNDEDCGMFAYLSQLLRSLCMPRCPKH